MCRRFQEDCLKELQGSQESRLDEINLAPSGTSSGRPTHCQPKVRAANLSRKSAEEKMMAKAAANRGPADSGRGSSSTTLMSPTCRFSSFHRLLFIELTLSE
jgi:hypothetical protein